VSGTKRIESALISVFHKDGLEPIVAELKANGVRIYSTGGTQKHIESLGAEVIPVENLTSYPSILGGRVKTLHPKVFGGILGRRENDSDVAQLEEFEIPPIDLVIVDLYPFEQTVASGADQSDIIEKIDIGGIALIRAAAKNHSDVVIVPSKTEYPELLKMLNNNCSSTSDQRRSLAAKAFGVSSHYDSAIYSWLSGGEGDLRISSGPVHPLRYGENPHQNASFYGDMDALFTKLHGKDLSYNNLLDLEAALDLLDDLSTPGESTFVILKHNNACGAAIRSDLKDAWSVALSGDPVSAFGGILATDTVIDTTTAEAMNKIFFELVIAPGFDEAALEILKQKKNRIILKRKATQRPNHKVRTNLNGFLVQDNDLHVDRKGNMQVRSKRSPSTDELIDLEFANILVKHTKSNAIVLAKGKQLLASGTGQTSRVDALEQAIAKAKKFENPLEGAVMASDAFFPFPDCVTIAGQNGIKAVVQPGGSMRDQESIDQCDASDMSMVFTGHRHFKH
jgi:phosphoribosylaminoimidazolecarboxamide formyltransferase/IMP cyclohydrolase